MLPLAMAVFLFAGFLYITLKERPDGQGMDPGTKRLFLITLILSVLYVLLIRHAGFILLSSLLLYCLEYIYTAAGQDCCQQDLVQEAEGGGNEADCGPGSSYLGHGTLFICCI